MTWEGSRLRSRLVLSLLGLRLEIRTLSAGPSWRGSAGRAGEKLFGFATFGAGCWCWRLLRVKTGIVDQIDICLCAGGRVMST